MNKGIITQKNIITGVAIALLVMATPSGLWPYGYYVFLRWAVTGTALFVLWKALEINKKRWVLIMTAIAILFNPITPIHLDKETWTIIDLIIAGTFLISIFKIKNNETKN
jgi:hypothetical protein